MEPVAPELATRLQALDWGALEASLFERGYARLPELLAPEEGRAVAALYSDDTRFRSRIDMARHGFGRGHYSYFAEPLPESVAALREALYGHLAPIADGMMEALGKALRFPPTLAGFRAQCRRAGQTRPTPLLLRYGAGDYNCLHRDLYGELAFPLQATVLLSNPETDFGGGEFLVLETRPRQQSVGTAVRLAQGEGIVFAVDDRPARGRRGWRRVWMRHGVSRLEWGERYALGVIFHDAR